MEAKRAATGEGSAKALSRVAEQKMAGTPFVVLSGNVQPGQSSDPASGFSTIEKRVRLALYKQLHHISDDYEALVPPIALISS